MNHRRKKRNILSTIALFLLLILGCSITMMLLLKVHSDKREIENMQDKIEDLSDELKDLSDLVEIQSDQIEVLSSKINEQSAESEKESEPAAELLDIKSEKSGTVIKEEQIDRNNLKEYFVSMPIPEDVFERIDGQSYVENSHITIGELRYMKLLHYNFDHELQVGELIVSAALEQDFLNIFMELFAAEYEIQSMHLIDNYWTGDGESSDTASIDVNNTSAFCYRLITGGNTISNHGLGRAIDINPQQNPYVDYSSGSPVWYHDNADDFIARDTGYEHVITHDDVCYKIFTKYGFEWGGDWSVIKDYQHFEKP